MPPPLTPTEAEALDAQMREIIPRLPTVDIYRARREAQRRADERAIAVGVAAVIGVGVVALLVHLVARG